MNTQSSQTAKSNYVFSEKEDWFSLNIPTWIRLFQEVDFKKLPRRVLEIGSHEGRSSTWLIEHQLKSGDVLHAIDSWEPWFTKERLTYEAEERFDHNIAIACKLSPGVSVVKHKGKSSYLLPRIMIAEGQSSFDLIYVDGGHDASQVLTDLVYAFSLCKVGGAIVCDDYLMSFGQNPSKTPKLAIDGFTNSYCDKISIVRWVPLYQLYIIKNAE